MEITKEKRKQEEQQKLEKEVKVEKPKVEKVRTEKKKLSFKEQKEWETIEADIEKIEMAIMEREEGIATAGSDFTRLQQLTNELDELNAQYEHLIERFDYLSAIVEGKA